MKTIIIDPHLVIVSDNPDIIQALEHLTPDMLREAVTLYKFRKCFELVREASHWLHARAQESYWWMPALAEQVEKLCKDFDTYRVHGNDCKDLDVPGRNFINAAKPLIEKLQNRCDQRDPSSLSDDTLAGEIASNLKVLCGQLAVVIESAEQARKPITNNQPALEKTTAHPDAIKVNDDTLDHHGD